MLVIPNARPPPAETVGAYWHSGVLRNIDDTVFDRNSAGQDGLTIMTLGNVIDSADLTLGGSTLFCSTGRYGFNQPQQVSPYQVLIWY